MKGISSPPLFSAKRFTAIGVLLFVFLTLSSGLLPYAKAYNFFPNTPITIASNTGHLELTFGTGTCSWQSNLYAFYVEPSSGIVYWSSSTSGLTWTNPAALFTLTSPASTTVTLLTSELYKQTCNGPNVTFGWIDNSGGVGKFHIDYEFCTVQSTGGGAPTCNAIVTQQPLSKAGGTPINMASGSTIDDIEYLNGLIWLTFTVIGVNRGISVNGISSSNTTTINAFTIVGWVGGTSTYIWVGQGSGSTQYQYSYTTNSGTTWHCCTTISTINGGNINGPGSGTAPGQLVTIGSLLYLYYGETHSGGACATTQCLEVLNFNAQGAVYNQVVVGDFVGITFIQATTDGISTIVIFGGSTAGATGTYTVTTNANTASPTYTTNNFAGPTASGGATGWPGSVGETFSPQLGMFVVETGTQAAPFNVYVQVFGVPPSSGLTQSVTLGSCPTKNTATTTLANNTEYLWTNSYFSGAVINNLQAEVASVNSGGSSGETLYFGIYLTPFSGAVSTTNPLTLVAIKTFIMSATSSAQSVTWGPSAGFPQPTGATVGIALLGNSKIKINQSSLSGMFTASGSGGSAPTLVASITALSSNAAQLFFCGTMVFQSVITTTVTSTSTSVITTGGTATATTTTTSTVTSLTGSAVAGTVTGFVILLLVILLPAFVLALIGVATKSPALTGVMFIVGLGAGTGLGNLAGIVPFYVVAIMSILIIFASLGLVVILTRGGAGP